ncbi:EboA domain-containing protein [Streptomyces sp. NPDC059063]|uniref:EboA domain-containing protein n=1 Tax=unclassified Streptomyces TaxID=2593676 RepID=UPI0036B1C19F
MPITYEHWPDRLGPRGTAWMNDALADARAAASTTANTAADTTADPAAAGGGAGGGVPAWELRFAAAGRACGFGEAAERARVLLLRTARPDAATVARLYAQGTGPERRAVLLALPDLPLAPDQGLALVEDALRANDTALIAAAVGPYAGARLTAHAWRHAVLKCLFTGVAVSNVAALAERARGDGELARMLGDFAAERTAAARPVPEDLRHVLALTAQEA